MSIKKIISNKIIAGVIAFFISCLFWVPIFLILGSMMGFNMNNTSLGLIPSLIVIGTFYAIYSFLRKFKDD